MSTIFYYLIALGLFFVIDMIWLGFVARSFYKKQIGFLMTEKVKWPVAILFYLLFVLGLVVFVIVPAVEQSSFVYALGYGGFFGFITYATYDLTNLATLKDWPVAVTIVDLVWGTFLGAIVSSATYAIVFALM